MKINPNNRDKQINAKDAANENKGDKNRGNRKIVLVAGPSLGAVDREVHVVRPGFQSGQNEETEEAVEDVVVVDVVVGPLRG